MKKKYILLFVLAITCLLLTGCDDTRLEDDEALLEYLKTEYKYEKFEIIKYYETDPREDGTECGYKGPDKHYVVKSKKTGVSFVVEDQCTVDLYISYYDIYDTYYIEALKQLKIENPKSKMIIEYESHVAFKTEYYNTKDEMIEDIWNIVSKLKKYPFKYEKLRNRIGISIEGNDKNYRGKPEEIKNKKAVQGFVDEVYQ